MASVQELAKWLQLGYLRNHAEELIEDARQKRRDYGAFLEDILTGELEQRTNRGNLRRIKEARFPIKHDLTNFDKTKYDTAFLPKFEELETLRFIDNKENIILLGTSGAGKTHYATALGIKACMEGRSVLFSSVPNLVVEMREAMNQQQLTAYRRRFERYALVILDELGYVSFDKTGSELFFNLLSNRYGKGSIIVTSNHSFDRWETIFADPVLTGALIDRLAHKAHVLDISRDQGGRFEETIAWMTNGREDTAIDEPTK